MINSSLRYYMKLLSLFSVCGGLDLGFEKAGFEILIANELTRRNANYPELPKKMVEYLLGQFDFYKVISLDNGRLTQIQSYNLRGTLNKANHRNLKLLYQ